MSTPRDSVTVRVPGSTSNCGAGFDTLGLALSVYNRVTLTRTDGAEPLPAGPGEERALAMVKNTADLFARSTGVRVPGFRFRIEGDVPPARGLGSSVTVIAGVLAGLDALCGTELSRHRLTALATELEGHPDNASAGVLGGFTVSRCDPVGNQFLDTIKVPVPADLRFVVVSPAVELLTKESRGALPDSLPYFDAVKSINSAAYLTAAFATGDYEKLRNAVSDFMHEPYRLPKITGGRQAISAGIEAGAFTGWLSGSGSSVLCVAAEARASQVAEAMSAAFASFGVKSETRILVADNDGLQVG
ncbi:MAG: homoserine kinase [Opitutus sp.]|nr:homoserine kinase [Opitutus sp.]